MTTVSVERIGEVPCLVYLAEGLDGKNPLLLHYHGWGGNKQPGEELEVVFRKFAGRGWVVVCPDVPLHGDRRRPELEFRKMFNGWAYICEAMEGARAEAGALVRGVGACLPVDTERVVVSGSSMGGLIAQMVVLEVPGARRAVSVIGRSGFYQADPWCRRAQEGTWCDAWCAERAPQSHPERYRERALFFIDGGLDNDCPAAVNAETVRRIREAGGHSEHFVDPEAGHQFSQPMMEQWERWVLAGV